MAPKFLSRGQTFREVIGNNVILPCEVLDLGSYVVLWRRGAVVLTAGNLMITRDNRFSLIDGHNLEIRNVRPQDAGDYVCSIGSAENKEQTHTLEILVPPVIRGQPAGGSVTARKGGSVTLECKASGNPVPTITWTKKGPSGITRENIVEGFSLTLEQVDRHQAGIYQCSANNGVGTPATFDINLNILYPPEIEMERSWVHSGVGYEAQLVCIVHAEPPADVRWYKEAIQQDPNEQFSINNMGSKHFLSIRGVRQDNFGNYSCVAENSLGRAKKYMVLSGKPSPALFLSEAFSRGRDFYNLSWEVTSWPPLLEVKLMWRRVQMNDSLPVQGKWHDVILAPNPITASIGHVGKGGRHQGAYVIRPLQPGCAYEAVVQAKNKYGWNDVSEIHKFYTRSNSESLLDEANDVMDEAGPHASTKGMSAATHNLPHRTANLAVLLPLLALLIASCNFA
ncbi:limbic system-associated membrane protein-like isoform X2 [Neocloeon triangulifer]|nr:limbic system-associated membrane protein-like isoform X2 [Neocloeon triangulifer]